MINLNLRIRFKRRYCKRATKSFNPCWKYIFCFSGWAGFLSNEPNPEVEKLKEIFCEA